MRAWPPEQQGILFLRCPRKINASEPLFSRSARAARPAGPASRPRRAPRPAPTLLRAEPLPLYTGVMSSSDDEEEGGGGAPLSNLTAAEAGQAALAAVQASVGAALVPGCLPVVAVTGDAASAVVAAALAAVAEDAPAAAAFVTGEGPGAEAARERARYVADLLGLELFEVDIRACALEDGPDCVAPSPLAAVRAAAAAAAGRAPCLLFCGAASAAGVEAAASAGALCPLAGLPPAVVAAAARAAGVPDWADGGEEAPSQEVVPPSKITRTGLTLVDAANGVGGRVLAAAGRGGGEAVAC